jgi:uncharacterized protein (DUF2147 family)
MRPYRTPGLASLALIASLSGAAAQERPTEPPTGTWLTEGGEVRVRIAPCASAYCGTIVWSRTGGTDANNPDPALRSRSMVGVQLISGLHPDAEGGYTGQIYNPRDGGTYTVKIKLRSRNTLELSGCILGGVICQSQTWSRVS